MIKLVITDIGGILIKTDEAIIQCIEQVFKENNIQNGSREDLLSAFGVSIFDYVKNYLPKEHKDKADFCYQEFKKIYPSQAKHLMYVYTNINETLTQIKNKNIQICILSCMVRDEVKANLSLLQFKDFNTIFSLEDYGHKRPLPNGLQMIMQKVNAKPEETIYIGDTINDIKMAKNAGCTSVAVKTGAQPNEQLESENPDYLINDFSELPNIIETINKK